mmetsp:Transcript_29590/g.38255  ORF Transcript_29590/g.38255 Transcript_29590/m.38255 type:complete len:242 (+) Transcript_29590:71-796(+)
MKGLIIASFILHYALLSSNVYVNGFSFVGSSQFPSSNRHPGGGIFMTESPTNCGLSRRVFCEEALWKTSLATVSIGFSVPSPSAAASSLFTSDDKTFQFQVPEGFENKPKLVKTHLKEETFKSYQTKGFNIGVAVDPVKLESVDKFGTPEEVAQKVLKVEAGKEGYMDSKLFSASSTSENGLIYYLLDYTVSSSRGENRYIVKLGVKANKLYVFTAQIKQKDYESFSGLIDDSVKSFCLIV